MFAGAKDPDVAFYLLSKEKLGEIIESARTDITKFHELMIRDSTFTYVAKQCPGKATLLFKLLLEHTEEFDRIVPKALYLTALARDFPEFADELMQFVLSHPKEFGRLVKTEKDLNLLRKSEQFKRYSGFFSDKTRDEVLHNITENIIQAKIAVILLTYVKNEKTSPLSKLNLSTLLKIASLVADSEIYTDETRMKIAGL